MTRAAPAYRVRSTAYQAQQADTVDHVVPRSRGGAHSWRNPYSAFRRNHRKGDRLLTELGWALPAPRRPRAHATAVGGQGADPFRAILGRAVPETRWIRFMS